MRVILHYVIYANTKKVSIQNYELFVSSYPFIPKLPSPSNLFLARYIYEKQITRMLVIVVRAFLQHRIPRSFLI